MQSLFNKVTSFISENIVYLRKLLSQILSLLVQVYLRKHFTQRRNLTATGRMKESYDPLDRYAHIGSHTPKK